MIKVCLIYRKDNVLKMGLSKVAVQVSRHSMMDSNFNLYTLFIESLI